MAERVAPGLPADWLNGWLAAIGVTVLLPDVRLSWTDDAVPLARFHFGDGVDLAAAVYEALPDEDALNRLAIARELDGLPEFPRTVQLDAYRSRAAVERIGGAGVLAASVTDLVALKDGEQLPHAPFDAPAPQGQTLWQRLVACRRVMTDVEALRTSLLGAGQRVPVNGLGFDIRRLPSRAGNAGILADPVVEMLVFQALPLFPLRGNGRRPTPRGWTAAATRRGAFRWGTWRAPLDRWAIDGWLDLLHGGRARDVSARFASVAYQPAGSSDVTRGYASERLP